MDVTNSREFSDEIGLRRFGRVNWLGTYTLMQREVRRFLNVWSQTVMAPLINSALLVVIFSIAVGSQRGDVLGVPFLTFIMPGVMMMTVIQQAFANPSSSLISAKMQGNIVDTLMPPLSGGELLAGYIGGAIVRGLMVGAVLLVALSLYLWQMPAHLLWCVVFFFVGGAFMGALGLIAGIMSNKFDQLSAISNFIITPLAFLSGSFYSIEALPPLMRALCHINPVFYIIDGGRYGMIGISDSSPWLGLGICCAATSMALALAWRWLRRGYRLKA